MSTITSENKKNISITDILAKKSKKHEKIVMVTCYDGAFARLLNDVDLDMVLVGDSVGNVCLGFENTIPVTMEHMVHHTAAVARRLERAFLVADMPFLSYGVSIQETVKNAGRLIQEGNAKAVKIEGGRFLTPHIKALVDVGIPVMGHIGLTPQSIHALGGYRVQGKSEEDARRLLEDAQILAEAGIFSLVLEMVPSTLASMITEALTIPTIGIGAGAATDGQVLVLNDLLGLNPDFKPKFAKQYVDLGKQAIGAVQSYANDVRSGEFPAKEHGF
jgi:3-methyl-2-oxobutanoate hydroxymethyltransferase